MASLIRSPSQAVQASLSEQTMGARAGIVVCVTSFLLGEIIYTSRHHISEYNRAQEPYLLTGSLTR